MGYEGVLWDPPGPLALASLAGALGDRTLQPGPDVPLAPDPVWGGNGNWC